MMQVVMILLTLSIVSITMHERCGPRAGIVYNYATRFGEVRQRAALPHSIMRHELYANLATGSWTLIENRVGGRACVIGMGLKGLKTKGNPT